ncbi:hypothetical protein JCM3766R1_002804 [Sporobolomyces carnicolor]
MPAIRSRKSSLSDKVTLYEPAVSVPPEHPGLRRSTRSLTATQNKAASLFKESSDEDEWPEEEDSRPAVKDESPVEVKPVKKRTASPSKKAALLVPHPAPRNWERQYEIINEQRKRIVAPVDLMGCEQGGRDASEPVVELSWKDRKLSTLVSLMLSSQTKDPVTHTATQNLRHHLPLPGLSLESLLGATVEQIDECIKKVGFHTTKAGNLKLMAEKVRDEHGGEVPEDLDKLLEFRGVGPKMAFIACSSWGYNIGIGVDTHVHRITHRLRWHKKEPKNAEETRVNLESWLPQERWPLVNKMLVGFGQEICRPVGPRCDLCDLGNARMCPSRRTVAPRSPSKAKVKVEAETAVKIEAETNVKPHIAGGDQEGRPKIEIGIEIKREEHIKLELA